ncbi:MAG: competence protein ComEC family protein [Bacteroidales bacterium]|nr:competence protein ComEC family protein [Bacteroidales bacterium]
MYFSFLQIIKQLPFIRLIIPFIVGISLQIGISYTFDYYLLFAVLLIILLFIEFIKYNNRRYKLRFISGISINLLFLITGAWLVQVNTNDVFEYYEKEIIAEVLLSEQPVEKEKSFKTFAEINKLILNDSIYGSDKKIVIYFEKDSFAKKLNYGDKIIFKSRINEIKTSGNPYEFDYKQFLFRKGIVGQIYLRSANWKRTAEEQANSVFAFANKARNYLANIYRNNNIEGNEFAVLQALTLGDKSEIDEDVRQSYVASGAMHILAVSGLHVGIIYVLFNFFFRFFDKLKTKNYAYGKVLKAAILIIILWSFAIISGLSPSVSRAATMFTFVIIGRAMKRKINIYNSLAASAFILLLINPYQITNVGFQLSYAAVFAIVYFQPRILKIFVIKNKVIYYIWSLTAVSIAAQIGTIPITLFYFHVFPWYFMLTNIIVIPVATLIIYLAVALLLTSFIPAVSSFFAYILNLCIQFLNNSVSVIESLPYSFSENISFNTSDLIFSSLLVILFAAFISYKQVKTIYNILLILIIWLSCNTFSKAHNNSNNKLFVYNIKDISAINIIGEKNYLITSKNSFNKNTIKYGPLSNWQHLNKTNYIPVNISDSVYISNSIVKYKNFILSNSKKILIINNETQIRFQGNDKFNIDYIIISGNPEIKIKEVLELFNTETIIFDSSNKYYSVKEWEIECKNLNQNYHSVIDNGAFSKKLQ